MEGDGDDDLFCNLTNYGPFAEEEAKYSAFRDAIKQHMEDEESVGA